MNNPLFRKVIFLGFFFLGFLQSTQAAWFDTDWSYRIQVTSDQTKVVSTEADIPLYIDLSNMPASFFSNVKGDGSDIRVTANDETTLLDHDLVSLNTATNSGELHVKVSSLSDTAGTDIYIYYGNTSATSSNTPNTWNDYRGVWHLDEAATVAVETRIGVASINAMDGSDGGWPVLYGNNPITHKISLAVDEDQIGDTERNHTTEQIAYWTFETDAAFDIHNSTSTIVGEGGIMSNLGTTPTAQTLQNTYTNPVVITIPNLTNSANNPAIVRVTGTTATSFTAYMQNPGDGSAPSDTDIYYIVIEAGAHTLPGGVLMEAGTQNVTGQNSSGNWGSGEMVQLTPTNTYTNPVVLGQVITTNDSNWSTFWTSDGTQQGPPDSSNIYVGIQIGADSVATRAAEDIGYVILEQSSGTTNNINWDAALGGDTVQGVGNSPAYTYNLSGSALAGAFKDSTINSFNADFQGGVNGQVSGQVGNSVNVDGTTGTYLPIGGLTYTNVNNLNQLTASMWLNTTDTARSGILDFDRSEHWEVGLNFHNAGGKSGTISFDTASSANGIRDLNSNNTINDGNWHHVVVVFDEADANDKKIYIDGVLDVSTNQHTSGLGKGTTRYGFLGDGSEANTVGGNVNNIPYEGMIDEVRIQHSAVNADRISTIYNNESDNSSFWSFSTETPLNNTPNKPETLHVNSNDSQAGQVNPTDLTIGGGSSHSLEFSAIYDDDDTSDTANQARIQVSTDSTFSGITHWDSGWTSITNINEGDRSIDIEYDNLGSAATTALSMDDGNINYYWRIAFADNAGEQGEFSDPGFFTILDIPNAPSGVSVMKIAGTPDTFSIHWLDTSTNEASFEIQVDEDNGGGFTGFSDITSSPVAADTVTDTNTTDNMAYMYRARSCNYAGCSSYVADPLTHYTDPPSPAPVFGNYDSDTQFTVNYTDRSLLAFIDIEHCIGITDCNAGTFTVISNNKASVQGVASTETDTTGIVTNETYRWRARATDAAETTLSEYTISPFEYTSPSAPSSIIAQYVTDNLINVTWTDNSNFEDGFRIWISENGGAFAEITTGVNTVGENSTNYIFTTAQPNTTYTFRVLAHIGATLHNAESFSVNADSGTVKSSPEQPTGITSVYNADNDIDVSWTDNASSEDGYEVYVSENGGAFALVTTLAADATTYSYTAGTSDSFYTFIVDAIVNASAPENPDKLSTRSNETNPELYTTPNSPVIASNSVSNASLDWNITDNSAIEEGFIIYDVDGATEIARLLAPNLTAWTETGLNPNTQYTRSISALKTNPGGLELISPQSAQIAIYTLANAPEDIIVLENGASTNITWTDGDNPTGTEFFAEELISGDNSGWSTNLFWSTSLLTCNQTKEILLKSRNGDGVESLAEIVVITGSSNCVSSSGGSAQTRQYAATVEKNIEGITENGFFGSSENKKISCIFTDQYPLEKGGLQTQSAWMTINGKKIPFKTNTLSYTSPSQGDKKPKIVELIYAGDYPTLEKLTEIKVQCYIKDIKGIDSGLIFYVDKQLITDGEFFLSADEEISVKEENTECIFKKLNRKREHKGKGISQDFFLDTEKNHKSYKHLIDLAEQEIVQGDDETRHARLDDPISRAEAIKILAHAREDNIKEGAGCLGIRYRDVERSTWYNKYIEHLSDADVIHGYKDGLYRPSKNINFAELYKIGAIGFGFLSKEDANKQIEDEWYLPYHNSLINNDIIPEWFSKYNFDDSVTRGNLFSFVSEILQYLDSK